MSRDKESLIEKAAEITAMQEAYSYLTTKFESGMKCWMMCWRLRIL